MSSKVNEEKSRDEVLAAREAKKLAKQKAKNKGTVNEVNDPALDKAVTNQNPVKVELQKETVNKIETQQVKMSPKSKDEVDRAVPMESEGDKDRDNIKAERAAKKAAKQAKKKGAAEGDATKQVVEKAPAKQESTTTPIVQAAKDEDGKDMTVKDLVETLKGIVNVAREVQEVTTIVQNIDLGSKKPEETGKSKAELRAERRAKQEAQRAAKHATVEQNAKPKEADASAKPDGDTKVKEVKTVKTKTLDKPKAKSQTAHRISWFQHLYNEPDKESLRKIAINSNLHPAIVKLGVQLASHVVTGSNARFVALLDALKKMVRDYTVPAKTEFARGLESHLATSLAFLWSMRQPSASQTNAVKFFRHHIMQLPNNVDEFDAKKTLQEEIDRYIREQIDKAGEAISIAVRNKISNGDNILTYGCSSLIERILVEAWEAGVRFRTVVVGSRVQPAGAEMLRRLTTKGLFCTYVDYTALNFAMKTTQLVVVGASALLADGSVRGAGGAAGVALAARARNVPVLVAAETHKFSERVQTDAFVYNELGDPDDLIDKTDENSPLKDWRSNPNLTPLNLTYDVTPPSLVTAIVTELGILPCTSAPVVLRYKLSDYGI